MHPLHPLFAFLIFGLAFITSYVIQRIFNISYDNARHENIEGLRGLLAIGVYISHASIWHQYLHNGDWARPDSLLYSHLGESSVSLFFMITSYLFITKLLNDNISYLDWIKFYKARFLRIAPMYFFSLLILLAIVFFLSNWTIRVSSIDLLKQLAHWALFNIFGSRNINDCDQTYIVNAYVVWTLAYEWLFYFSLPLLALIFLKKKSSILILLFSIVFTTLFFLYKGIHFKPLTAFAGGGIAPLVTRYYSKEITCNNKYYSLVILICLLALLTLDFLPTAIIMLLLVIVFNLIVLGNSFFEVLTNPILKTLGLISYSTYLIHGILLFVFMQFYYGIDVARNLSGGQYCIFIAKLTPALVILSYALYKFIEEPFISYSKK